MRKWVAVAGFLAFCAVLGAQTLPEAPAYQPKFAGDKARSEAEFSALAYMRTVVAAEKNYHKKHNRYADSLHELVGSGSFTRRMVSPERGDYSVSYRSTAEGYALALTPRQFDAAHRAFYVDQSGGFRVQDSDRATASSPPLK